jgi:RimJ/RimL family protein N-acetyltransferase
VTAPPAPSAAPGGGPYQPEYPIRTERLLLRPYAHADVDALYAYQRLPEIHRYLYTEPRTRSEIEALVAERAGSAVLTEAGQAIILVADLAQTGELVGDCVLFWRSQEHRQGEVGYVFNPAYHGRGLATEAVGALLRLGFEGLGLHRIAGHLDARNTASVRVLERAGLRREAHLVENEFIKGEWTDELIYAILRSEWAAGQSPG